MHNKDIIRVKKADKMCDCDFVTTDIHTKKVLKTRSPHKCVECGELISKGTMMHRVTTLAEGLFDRHYTCLDCEAISKYLVTTDPDFCICYGELVEVLLTDYGFSTLELEDAAKKEGIPSAFNGGVVKGRYSTYKLDAPWLTPRIGGKFKLAIDENERQLIPLVI